MRVLIVEDHQEIARLTREMLLHADQALGPLGRITDIETVRDLETAVAKLPCFDAVLCDGEFLLSPESARVLDEWAVVALQAHKLGVRFVLYSGSAQCCGDARNLGLRTIEKPSPVAPIYRALTA
jgi:hypothetical protein